MNKKYVVIAIISVVALSSCSVQRGGNLVERIRGGYYPYKVKQYVRPGYTEYGTASWYGNKFHGRRTADGEIYNMYAMTAAHKTLPFNTYVQVTNLNNHREAVVRINDRGPFVGDRIIDLSYAAAKKLGMIGTGTAPVKLVVLSSNRVNSNQSKQDENIDENINTNPDLNAQVSDSMSQNASKPAPSYYVQIGSFRILANALKFRDRASQALEGVQIIRVVISGEVFYRVVVGPFSTKDAAFYYAKRNVEGRFGSFCIIK